MSGTISEAILCHRDDDCPCELHQALRERDEARQALERYERALHEIAELGDLRADEAGVMALMALGLW